MTRIVIVGSKGRMGQTLLTCAGRQPQFGVVGQIDEGDDPGAVIAAAEVVIDFSVHTVTPVVAELAAGCGRALVIGTTGFTEPEKDRIRASAARIPIVWSTNYSTGMNTLFWLIRRTVEVLGPDYDLEVVEMHHRMKQDAPSGTATVLAEILAAGRATSVGSVVRHGRNGLVGPRPRGEIGMHAIRGGDVMGDHTVIFAGAGERLELTHRASSRETFANGALRAAAWVVGRRPGIYTMQHVLELE